MKISVTTNLSCTRSDAWDALHNPDVFQAVSAPFLSFEAKEPSTFPLRFESKKRYVVQARAFGFIPMGTQEINPVDSTSGDCTTFTDNGRGLSGPLKAVTTFRHQMTLQPSGTGPTKLTDVLEFRAGLLTPALWIGFRLFWWWRHKKMATMAPQWQNHATALWDERYNNTPLWSGAVNPTLISMIRGKTPGTALDVGAGEGADALWLAEQGCNVTALDVSPRALSRGEKERQKRVCSDSRERNIRWIASDSVTDELPAAPKTYDLVVSHFLHLPQAEREIIWKKLVHAVAPGGQLLIVGHAPEDLKSGVGRPPADLMFQGQDVRRFIPSSWSSVRVTRPRRTQRSAEGAEVEVNDVVVFATR